MAEILANGQSQRNDTPQNHNQPIGLDGNAIESPSPERNLSRQRYQSELKQFRDNQNAPAQSNSANINERRNDSPQTARLQRTDNAQQLGGRVLNGVGRGTSRLGGGVGRVTGATVGAGVGAVGGLMAGGVGVVAGARAGATKGQQIGGQVGKFAGDKMRRSGMLLDKSGKNIKDSKASEIIDAIGQAGKEGSRMLLNTFWCSVWVDFTLVSLLYLNCHLFASKMMPQLVCQFGEDDVIGTWLGGGRLGTVTGAVGVDGKALAEIIEILILVILDLFVLAIVGLIIFLLFNIYDAIEHPGKALWYIVRTGQWGLLNDLIGSLW